MDHGYICLKQTKRLILILGIAFSVVTIVQYFELPYASSIPSLLSPGKVSLLGKNFVPDGNSSTNISNDSNSTLVSSWMKETDNGKGRATKSDFVSDNGGFGPSSYWTSENSTKNVPRISSDSDGSLINNKSYLTDLSLVSRTSRTQILQSTSISKMNELLRSSRSFPHSVPPQSPSRVDQQLLKARSQIENPSMITNDTEFYAPLYRNVSMFKRSYEIMDSTLKVYIYKEGEKPIFHQSILEGIYSCEGWFLKLIEGNKQFVTEDPREAHLFYLPFSSRLLQLTLYVRNSHSRDNLIQFMKNYTEALISKYPFWNRTDGADHFLAACHDWAPAETRGHMLNCIRALCNADIQTGFQIGKDVSIPTTYVRSAKNPLKDAGGEPLSRRRILAFFAGYMHGYVRPVLLKYWGNDTDMRIFGRMPHVKGNKNYIHHMKSSKFCICARGFAVHSPRVVESIFYECIPVIISDNYVPPFFEVLNWESFAVFILEKDIPNLKNILQSISEEKYLEMHKRLKKSHIQTLSPETEKELMNIQLQVSKSKEFKKLIRSNIKRGEDMATETKSSVVRPKPSSNQDVSSSKNKFDSSVNKKKAVSTSTKQYVDSKQKVTTTVSTTQVKGKSTSSLSKTTTKTTLVKQREKKVFSLPGQKSDPPEEREPLRIFYESLSKQIPSSEMAEFWMMEHGLLSPERAKRAYEKKQRKQKQLRMGTPIKSPPPSNPSSRAESSKKQVQISKNGDPKAKKRIINDSDDDDDFVLSHKRRKGGA